MPVLHAQHQFSSVAQPCSTLATPWAAAHQASLSITISQSLPQLMSIESTSASVLPMNITGFISLQSKGQSLQDTINVPFLFQWPQVSFCQQQPKEAQQIQMLNGSMSARIKNTNTPQSKPRRKGMNKQGTQERIKSNLVNQKKFNDRKEVYTQC